MNASEATSQTTTPAAILLVEDEPSLRRGMRLNLEAEGYRVTEFETAEAAEG